MKARDWGVVLLMAACVANAAFVAWAGYRAGFKDGQKSSCQELVDDAFRSGKAMGLKNGGRK